MATTVEAELASPLQRLGAALLDTIIAVVTLGIGWFVWYLIVAMRGQSPGKQILGLRVVRGGVLCPWGWMLVRDIGLRVLAVWALVGLLSLINGSLGGLAWLLYVVAALWLLWDAQRQCLWDKVVDTHVVSARHLPASGPAIASTGGAGTPTATVSPPTMFPADAPPGGETAENLRTLAELRDRGLLAEEEYEERRARELGGAPPTAPAPEPAPEPAIPSDVSPEIAENLRTLAELRDRGLLTEEEYEERRARELGGR